MEFFVNPGEPVARGVLAHSLRAVLEEEQLADLQWCEAARVPPMMLTTRIIERPLEVRST